MFGTVTLVCEVLKRFFLVKRVPKEKRIEVGADGKPLVDTGILVNKEAVAQHCDIDDCWVIIDGSVYS
eukprot:gene15978-672_t